MKAGMEDHRGRVFRDEAGFRHAFHRGLLRLEWRSIRGVRPQRQETDRNLTRDDDVPGPWEMNMEPAQTRVFAGDDDAAGVGGDQGSGDRVAAVVVGHYLDRGAG